jgi:hypothetical protein
MNFNKYTLQITNIKNKQKSYFFVCLAKFVVNYDTKTYKICKKHKNILGVKHKIAKIGFLSTLPMKKIELSSLEF